MQSRFVRRSHTRRIRTDTWFRRAPQQLQHHRHHRHHRHRRRHHTSQNGGHRTASMTPATSRWSHVLDARVCSLPSDHIKIKISTVQARAHARQLHTATCVCRHIRVRSNSGTKHTPLFVRVDDRRACTHRIRTCRWALVG